MVLIEPEQIPDVFFFSFASLWFFIYSSGPYRMRISFFFGLTPPGANPIRTFFFPQSAYLSTRRRYLWGALE
jgi:hypothetical protein